MGRQSWLVVLLCVGVCAVAIVQTTSIADPSWHLDEKSEEILLKKVRTKVLNDDKKDTSLLKVEKASSTVDPSKDDFDDDYEYDHYDYDDDALEDEDNAKEETIQESNKTLSTSTTEKPKLKPIGKLKLIKGDDKSIPKQNSIEQKKDSKAADFDLSNDDIDDNDDDDDDDDYDDAITDEEEIVFNENVPCPRDCICARNFNSYLVATCSRLDADVQKFGSDITDLVVVDVGPKYPILLGPTFFEKIGLKHVASIKITNCTIEYIHPTAFHNLVDLYSVNLTNVGLTSIFHLTFANNTKLRMLTISGNDLSVMATEPILIKSESLEELDISRNNLNEIRATAFNQLPNIVYINLAQNNLLQLPVGLFDSVETVEELDLSFNNISTLPKNIFNRTALSILHLASNGITNDLSFVTRDLQTLDLSSCNIKQIHSGMFDTMEALTNLNLKGNDLVRIQPDSFFSLRNLRVIDLSYNALEQLSSLLFYKNNELNVIHINDNPRLSQLPNDGFQSSTGEFPTHLFDVSNCAVGALAHKTFSTMPHLVTLKLAWNNINNLDKQTFVALPKLTEFDLSNNLIVRLDDEIFKHNTEITKLNLAGNPIRKLSAKLFDSMKKLKELDVSECDMHTLLADIDTSKNHQIFGTLMYFNASFNQIKKINRDDIRNFYNLKTLDIHNNPLKCNDDFKSLIKYLSQHNIVTGKVRSLENLDDSFLLSKPYQSWDDFTRDICKHSAETFKLKEKTIEEIKKDIFKDTSGDIRKILYDTVVKNKNVKKEDPLKKAKEDLEEDTSLENDNDDNDSNDADSVEDYYNEYDENDKQDAVDEVDVKKTKVQIKEGGLFAEEVNIIKETKNKFLLDKLVPEDEVFTDGIDNDNDDIDDDDDDDDDDDEESEEILIEHGRIYYSGYRFLLPIVIILACVVILLCAIAKIISLLVRKRGERYRNALLASKNSIVYQKLSEEIAAPKLPKVHRYAPINAV